MGVGRSKICIEFADTNGAAGRAMTSSTQQGNRKRNRAFSGAATKLHLAPSGAA